MKYTIESDYNGDVKFASYSKYEQAAIYAMNSASKGAVATIKKDGTEIVTMTFSDVYGFRYFK